MNIKVEVEYFKAKDGSLHLSPKKKRKHNKLLKFMDSTVELIAATREGLEPYLFLSKEDAISWVKRTHAEGVQDSYKYKKISLPIAELLKLQANKGLTAPILGTDK